MRKFHLFIAATLMAVSFSITGCQTFDREYTNYVDNFTPSNPILPGNQAEQLDAIFNLDTLGVTTLVIKRSEWNKMLADYDIWYKQENYIHANYVYEKDGKTWAFKDVGMRLRGATTRVRPQGPDHWFVDGAEDGHGPVNSWDSPEMAQEKGYRQSHFKIDFEEFLGDDEEAKMSDATKGVNLKRFNSDPSYAREIYCYDLFAHYGIWTAPRASYTRLIIQFDEDCGDSKEPVTFVDYGIYEMFEDIGKQFVKARQSDKLDDENGSQNLGWGNKTGTLWKRGSGKPEGDLTNRADATFGVEKVVLKDTKEESIAASQFYTYDLKVDKKKLDEATPQLKKFIKELDACKTQTAADLEATKAWYNKTFDMDFFLKTLAVSVLTGMDDDYWGNANNYYLYFSSGKDNAGNKNEKLYMIPYDYDNTLGHSIKNPSAYQRDIMSWCEESEKGTRPLVEKALAVPEFAKIYRDYLKQIANDSYFLTESKSRIAKFQALVRPYTNSPDLVYDHNVSENPGSGNDWGTPILSHFNNMKSNVNNWYTYYSIDHKITFNLNGGSINGNKNDIVVTGPDCSRSFQAIIGKEKAEGRYLKGDLENLSSGGKTKYFRGWTRTRNGNDFLYRCPKDESELTVYAKWETADEMIYPVMPGILNAKKEVLIQRSKVQPAPTPQEKPVFVFTFNPFDFGLSYVPDEVYIVGNDFGYNPTIANGHATMTKNDDGTFTFIQTDTTKTEPFMFVIKGGEQDGMWIALRGSDNSGGLYFYRYEDDILVETMVIDGSGGEIIPTGEELGADFIYYPLERRESKWGNGDWHITDTKSMMFGININN